MKVKNPSTGNFEEVYVRALDSLPVGTEVDFDGSATSIPIGWERVSNPNTYTTTEKQTNMSWIDGHTIYRKVITGTTIAAGNFVEVPISTNLRNIIRVDGFIGVDTGNFIPITYSNTGAPVFYFINNNNLYLQVGNSTFENKDFYAVIEYTKNS